MDELKWNSLIEKFENSEIPDHAEGLLELVKMLKEEQEQIKQKLGE